MSDASPTAPPSTTNRILLVGWDAADWEMIDPLLEAGKMPHLARLIDEGVMASLATLHPIISPMLWTTIATGKLADKHGILGFTETDPKTGARPVTSTSRRVKALWNIFQQALGWRCNVAAWWASYPAEPLDGAYASNLFCRARKSEGKWKLPVHAIHPPELAKELLPQLLHISELDETLVFPFIPHAPKIDQKKDNRLEIFAALLTECINVQTVASALMEREPWNFTAVYFDSIDHFSHAFMPYHPPRMANISEQDFEIYGPVMAGVYQFHDLMLGRLIEQAGPETTVVLCSDHGFQSGGNRPYGNPREPAGPAFWHREFGIFVMKGPGVKRDERIYGASLLDVAPTLLTLAGLPVGRDMDGKPLLEALVHPVAPEPIASWDEVPGHDGRFPEGFEVEGGGEEAAELMRQFAALGYIDDPGEDTEKARAEASRESRYNLAEVYLSTSRPRQAFEILEALVAESPWESRYIHQLANAYLKAGYHRAALDLLDRAYPPEERDAEPPIVVWQMWAKARLGLGDKHGAARYLRYATDRMKQSPLLWIETGWLWLELDELRVAEVCFRRAVELDSDAAAGYQGLASIHLRRRENSAAIDAALQAVQRLYHLPYAHFYLGIALAREERYDEAIVAFQRVTKMRPGMPEPHRWLAALFSTHRPDSLRAGVHRNLSRRHGQERAQRRAEDQTRAKATRPIPDIPATLERDRLSDAARPLPQTPGQSGRTFTLVSGLPRSGTSLMMQMLAAGGLSPQTDGERAADVDNPEGYLEWEAIKRVGREPALLDEPGLEQRAIKVVSALLPQLPKAHRYRVIFMSRPVEEIARSQARMIAHRGSTGAEGTEAEIAAALRSHRDTTLAMLQRSHANFDLLEVDYPSLVADPAPWAARVAEFIGPELLPHPERMTGAVRRDLHRNKAASASAGEATAS